MYMCDELPSTPPIIDQLVCYDCELNCSVVLPIFNDKLCNICQNKPK